MITCLQKYNIDIHVRFIMIYKKSELVFSRGIMGDIFLIEFIIFI